MILLLLQGLTGFGQRVSDSSSLQAKPGFFFSPHYAYQIPGGDLSDRFGNFSSIGISANYHSKSGLFFGLEYDWFFGNDVLETDLFDSIMGESGQVIDQDGHFSVIQLNVRGNYVTGNVGYILNLVKKQPNTGVMLLAGVGWTQHKIDILSSQVSIPQINGEYEYGYDRLTYGLATKQFIGYQYVVDGNFFHFRAGVEFNQGFTKGRRTWNYTTNQPGTDDRFDSTVALKFALIVPVFTKAAEDEEFFID